MCIFGTRPDAIKMAPVVLELRAHPDRWNVVTVVTGQHREQLDQVLRVFGIAPDHDLNIMQPRQTLAAITTRALNGLDEVMAARKADVVLAQGDTTTTFVAALAAFYHQIPFGHVEAGLRTGRMYDPFPEEMNRKLAADLAAFHFAPTEEARGHLLREGVPPDAIHLTGNTGIDALLKVAASEPDIDEPEIADQIRRPGRLVLITAHRRENLGEPLADICRAIASLARGFADVRFVYAMHRNPAVRDIVRRELTGLYNVHLVEPPGYAPFVKLMQRATLILTDSGGIQEEAPSLGVPVLVLRRTTERPEGVAAGAARLVGTDTARIVAEAEALLSDDSKLQGMRVAQNPYGDGQAAVRIRRVLEAQLNG